MSTFNCSVCELPLVDHSDEMIANCSALDLSAPSGSGAENAPGRGRPPSTRPGAPIAGVSAASIGNGWVTSVIRELEELGADGPVGHLLPYTLDPDTPKEHLVQLLTSLRGVSGTEDKGLIGRLNDYANDVSGALASIMDRKAETIAGMDVERHFGTARKNWQSDVLAKEVAHRAVTNLGPDLIDLVSGETKPVSEAASVGASAVANAFAKAFRLEPRAGALRELGIEPDLYCESEPGRPGVIVRHHRDTIE